MVKEERTASFKYSVLRHAQKYKNVTLLISTKYFISPVLSIMSG